MSIPLLAAVALPAAAETLPPESVPAKTLAVPTADVSPQMQAFIAKPLNPDWNDQWKTGAEARAYANKQAEGVLETIPDMLARMHVKSDPTVIDGVRAYVLTPEEIAPENANRLLIHVHGGCYVLFPGAAGTTEGIMMAGFGHI
jgi:acetyl esterase/lipase